MHSLHSAFFPRGITLPPSQYKTMDDEVVRVPALFMLVCSLTVLAMGAVLFSVSIFRQPYGHS